MGSRFPSESTTAFVSRIPAPVRSRNSLIAAIWFWAGPAQLGVARLPGKTEARFLALKGADVRRCAIMQLGMGKWQACQPKSRLAHVGCEQGGRLAEGILGHQAALTGVGATCEVQTAAPAVIWTGSTYESHEL